MNPTPNPTRKVLIKLSDAGLCYRMRRSFFRGRRSVFWAVRHINLDIREGERVAIIGRNGAGKSTLLSLLGGLILPDEGKIKCPDKLKRQILSLKVGFEQVLTGEENAILSGLYLGRTARQVRRALPRIYETAELGEFFFQPLNTYSSGMRNRLGFAVAMETSPDVLMLDEVLGTVGDATFQKKSYEMLRQKLRSDIKTLIVVTHNMSVVREMCDRVILLNDGAVIMDGGVDEVLAHYEEIVPQPGRNVSSAPRRLPPQRSATHLRAFRWLIEKLT